MSDQTPSVVRMVHYVDDSTHKCRAAIITEVAGAGQKLLTEPDGREHGSDEVVVGLAVLSPSGMSFRRAAYHDGGETPGDSACPHQPHAEMPFRYCPQPGCGWREASLQGGTWHWPIHGQPE